MIVEPKIGHRCVKTYTNFVLLEFTYLNANMEGWVEVRLNIRGLLRNRNFDKANSVIS